MAGKDTYPFSKISDPLVIGPEIKSDFSKDSREGFVRFRPVSGEHGTLLKVPNRLSYT